jgi:hypothetical protein
VILVALLKLIETASPLQLGLHGTWRGVGFELTGRAQMGHEAAVFGMSGMRRLRMDRLDGSLKLKVGSIYLRGKN